MINLKPQTMKNLLTICFIMATVFTVNAQKSKPTKEETVQFIKEYMSKATFYECGFIKEGQNTLDTKSSLYKDINFSFDDKNSMMTIMYDYEYKTIYMSARGDLKTNVIEHYKILIDLNKVELISISSKIIGESGNSESCYIIQLLLNSSEKAVRLFKYNSNEQIQEFPNTPQLENQISFPINQYQCNGCDNEAINKKILQAFNHLRKLCGAPDPISFD